MFWFSEKFVIFTSANNSKLLNTKAMYLETAIVRALNAAGLTCHLRGAINRLGLFVHEYQDAPVTAHTVTIRPVTVRGSGKWTSYTDYSYPIKIVLNFISCPFVEGNDAPRSGKLGNYINYDIYQFWACLKAKTGFDLEAFKQSAK